MAAPTESWTFLDTSPVEMLAVFSAAGIREHDVRTLRCRRCGTVERAEFWKAERHDVPVLAMHCPGCGALGYRYRLATNDARTLDRWRRIAWTGGVAAGVLFLGLGFLLWAAHDPTLDELATGTASDSVLASTASGSRPARAQGPGDAWQDGGGSAGGSLPAPIFALRRRVAGFIAAVVGPARSEASRPAEAVTEGSGTRHIFLGAGDRRGAEADQLLDAMERALGAGARARAEVVYLPELDSTRVVIYSDDTRVPRLDGERDGWRRSGAP